MGDSIKDEGGQRGGGERSTQGSASSTAATSADAYGTILLLDPPVAGEPTPVEFEGVFLATPWVGDELKMNLAAALNQARQDWEPIKGSKADDRVIPAQALGSIFCRMNHLGAADTPNRIGLTTGDPLVDDDNAQVLVVDILHQRVWETTVEQCRMVKDSTFGESFDQFVRAYHQDRVKT